MCTVTPCTHNHLKEHIQQDDSLPQGLTEVVDGVIDGVLLGIQVEDPEWQRVRWSALGTMFYVRM